MLLQNSDHIISSHGSLRNNLFFFLMVVVGQMFLCCELLERTPCFGIWRVTILIVVKHDLVHRDETFSDMEQSVRSMHQHIPMGSQIILIARQQFPLDPH